jgi:hypothetical protein
MNGRNERIKKENKRHKIKDSERKEKERTNTYAERKKEIKDKE